MLARRASVADDVDSMDEAGRLRGITVTVADGCEGDEASGVPGERMDNLRIR